MTIASHSTWPSRFKCEPYRVENGIVFEDDDSGLDGVESGAAAGKNGQPAARARWQPDLQASTASSGMSHAPP